MNHEGMKFSLVSSSSLQNACYPCFHQAIIRDNGAPGELRYALSRKRTADPPLSCPGSYATIAATGRLARDSHLCAEIVEKVPFSLSGFYFRQLP